MNKFRFLILNCIILVSLGCGYTFQGAGSVLPPDIKNIYIPLVENNSVEAGLSPLMTEALKDSFERYGVMHVVELQSQADAVLKTKILAVQNNTRSVSSNTDTALQYDSVLVLSSQLQRPNGQVLWKNSNIKVSRLFGAASNAVSTSSADFALGGIGSQDLASLDSREISRGQQGDALNNLVEKAAALIYRDAVMPDF